MSPAAPPVRFRPRAGTLDTALRYDAVIERLRPGWRADADVLEVGSGSGGVTEYLAHPVTGVDPAFDRTADRATPFLTRVVGSATALPLADASFDVVICLEMLEHLPAGDRAPALAEMVRVLRPGGRLVATFPADPTAERLDGWLNAAYRARTGADHPWAIEHLATGLPRTEAMAAALVRAAGGAPVRIAKHLPAPAFKLSHWLYTVNGGSPWTKFAGLHSPWAARALFLVLRRWHRGAAYRTILVLDKPAGG